MQIFVHKILLRSNFFRSCLFILFLTRLRFPQALNVFFSLHHFILARCVFPRVQPNYILAVSRADSRQKNMFCPIFCQLSSLIQMNARFWKLWWICPDICVFSWLNAVQDRAEPKLSFDRDGPESIVEHCTHNKNLTNCYQLYLFRSNNSQKIKWDNNITPKSIF